MAINCIGANQIAFCNSVVVGAWGDFVFGQIIFIIL